MKTLVKEQTSLAYRTFLRFARVFGASAVSAMALQVAATPALATFTDLKVWLVTVIGAGIAAGIVAIDKYSRN